MLKIPDKASDPFLLSIEVIDGAKSISGSARIFAIITSNPSLILLILPVIFNSLSTLFLIAFCRVAIIACGSISKAVADELPSLSAAIAKIPDPHPKCAGQRIKAPLKKVSA